MTEALRPTQWQQRILEIPPTHNLAMFGGRGCGRSTAAAFLVVQTEQRLGSAAKMLYCRKSIPATLDFQGTCRKLFSAAYGGTASWNGQKSLWSFPSGASLLIHELSDETSLERFHGQSFALVIVDECQQHKVPTLIDRLWTCLRGKEARMCLCGNPGAPWLRPRFVDPSTPWEPFTEPATKRPFVYAPGTLEDNPFLGADYRASLEALRASDPELAEAWIRGDFSAWGSAFFGKVLSHDRNMVDDWPGPEVSTWWADPVSWSFHGSLDWGSSSPAICYLAATCSDNAVGADGRRYASGSVVIFDEVSSHDPADLSKGSWEVPDAAQYVSQRIDRWGVKLKYLWCDPSMTGKHGHEGGSLRDQMRTHGLYIDPAPAVSRAEGWAALRALMAAAGRDDRAGFYAARRCVYLWQTLPTLERARDPEDLLKCNIDHGADSARYLALGIQGGTGGRGVWAMTPEQRPF